MINFGGMIIPWWLAVLTVLVFFVVGVVIFGGRKDGDV